MRHLGGKSTGTESRMVGARGWGTGMGSECFMGREFQFGKMRKFRRWVYINRALSTM